MTILGASRERLVAGVSVVAIAAIALVAAGCGSGGGGSSGNAAGSGSSAQGISTTPPAVPTSCASKGGTIKVLSAGDVDHIDPGAAYYSFTYEVTRPTQRALLAVRPGTTKLIPDLAAAMPKISENGKTITVKLRHGVRFSPPVNREVTSADVKYAIERGFASSVANGYAGAYFSAIQGAPKTPPLHPQAVAGIGTPTKDTLVFHLTRPEGIFFGALSLPLTAPVPEAYARPFDNQAASTYGLHQVATGPYMIKSNSAGNINGVGYRPGTQIELVRNPNSPSTGDYRLACVDTVLFKEGFQDPTVTTKTILSGAADTNGDSPPPAAELKSIVANSRQRKQLFFTPTGGSRYVALNTRKAPFNKLAVRKAVAFVLDKNAMRLTRGGPVDGRIATHFIDPSFQSQGFTQAGGFSFDPFPSKNFSGDVARAKALMKQAGYANGMYSGPPIMLVADNTPPGSNTAKVVAADLAKIGLKVRFISVTHATMYTKYCNVPKNEPAVCPNVGWLPDFREPQTILDPTFNGKNILPVNNSNWPLLNQPNLNGAMNAAERILDPTGRYEAWGRIDKRVVETASAIPWLWENFPTVFSSRVVPSLMVDNSGAPDVSMMSIK